MRTRAAILVAASFCLWALGARAGDDLTAADLDRMCASKSNLDYGYCAGYVTAVADTMLGGQGGYRACNHGDVKSQQYVDIFRSYMARFPEARGDSASHAVQAAFMRAFPCGR